MCPQHDHDVCIRRLDAHVQAGSRDALDVVQQSGTETAVSRPTRDNGLGGVGRAAFGDYYVELVMVVRLGIERVEQLTDRARFIRAGITTVTDGGS